jgi:hypothetical protein
VRPTARPRTAQPLRAANPSATLPPRGGARPGGRDGGGSRRRPILLVVGALVIVLAAGIFAVTQLTGSDSPSTPQTTGNAIAPTPAAGGDTSTTSATRAKTTVAVLNGTTVPGLARSVADKLEARGYRIGTVTNAPDQQRSATQVAYQPGSQKVARDVAKTIDVGSDAVVPIDEVTSATAGTEALVVVTVGSDQSR